MPSFTQAVKHSVAGETGWWILAAIVAGALITWLLLLLEMPSKNDHRFALRLFYVLVFSGFASGFFMCIIGIAGSLFGIPGYSQQAGPPFNFGLPFAPPTAPEAMLDIAASWWMIEVAVFIPIGLVLFAVKRVSRTILPKRREQN